MGFCVFIMYNCDTPLGVSVDVFFVEAIHTLIVTVLSCYEYKSTYSDLSGCIGMVVGADKRDDKYPYQKLEMILCKWKCHVFCVSWLIIGPLNQTKKR